ncbi:hypothetical protein [Frankia sp. AvcI1]|uniref:hypothetical protein n=1 Tax=Frankia sp. AvcI1 TaxID=573496 RepID=UPI0021199EAC|nr:hypothetical protein [Frankia sp. AvcI1]
MTVDLDSPRAPWRGPRSPSHWTCPRCRNTAVADHEHPGALIIEHRPGCQTPSGLEIAHVTTTTTTKAAAT